jgi:putative ABC transport system permease protein
LQIARWRAATSDDKFQQLARHHELGGKQTGYSIICILGLALAFAACLTLFSYAYIQFHYDTQVPNNDRVFQVKSLPNYQDTPRWSQYPALGLRDAALNSGIDVIATVVQRDIVRIRTSNLPHQYLLRAVDPSFAGIFEPVGKSLSFRTENSSDY